MTVICAFLDSEGAGFVSDMRLLGECSIISDSFCKLWQLANDTLTVSISGEVGPAQQWFRAAEKANVTCVDELMEAQVVGDYNFLLYDAVSHALFSGDSNGCLVPVSDYAVHGIGEEFVRGYIAGKGMPESRTGKLSRLSSAVTECAKLNVSVSKQSDMVYVSRVVLKRGARREKRLQHTYRRVA